MARPPVGGRDEGGAWRLPRARAAQHATATCTTQTRYQAPPPPPRHLLDCSRSSLKAGSGISSASSAASALASWTPVLPVTVPTTSCTAMVALPPRRLRTEIVTFQFATGRFTVSRATGLVREQERSVLTLTLIRTARTPDTREFSLTLQTPADKVFS